MELFELKTDFKKIFLGYFYPPTLPTLCSENAEEMASGEEARFWADLNQKYIT